MTACDLPEEGSARRKKTCFSSVIPNARRIRQLSSWRPPGKPLSSSCHAPFCPRRGRRSGSRAGAGEIARLCAPSRAMVKGCPFPSCAAVILGGPILRAHKVAYRGRQRLRRRRACDTITTTAPMTNRLLAVPPISRLPADSCYYRLSAETASNRVFRLLPPFALRWVYRADRDTRVYGIPGCPHLSHPCPSPPSVVSMPSWGRR